METRASDGLLQRIHGYGGHLHCPAGSRPSLCCSGLANRARKGLFNGSGSRWKRSANLGFHCRRGAHGLSRALYSAVLPDQLTRLARRRSTRQQAASTDSIHDRDHAKARNQKASSDLEHRPPRLDVRTVGRCAPLPAAIVYLVGDRTFGQGAVRHGQTGSPSMAGVRGLRVPLPTMVEGRLLLRCGLLVVFIALESPIELVEGQPFWVHMLQHLSADHGGGALILSGRPDHALHSRVAPVAAPQGAEAGTTRSWSQIARKSYGLVGLTVARRGYLHRLISTSGTGPPCSI